MSLEEIQQYIKRLEKKQLELEDKQNKMEKKEKSQDKIIAELRMENLKIMDELNRKKEEDNDQNEPARVQNQVEREKCSRGSRPRRVLNTSKETSTGKKDTKKIKEPEYLSRLSLECIISYMSSSKRVHLSLFCPALNKIEKAVPLDIFIIKITRSSILIECVDYIFEREEKKVGCFEKNENILVAIAKSHRYTGKASVIRVANILFEGRTNLRVQKLYYLDNIGLKLKFNVRNILIAPRLERITKNYCDVVQSVEHLMFLELSEVAELRHPWVRNAKRLEKVHGNNACFLVEMPNLLAEKIAIHSENDPVDSVDLIRVWCRNRSRKVGSKLFLTFDTNHEVATINRVFSSGLLTEMGFLSISNEISCLRLDNGSKVRLTVKQDRDPFGFDYLGSTKFQRYLYLEVVDSSN